MVKGADFKINLNGIYVAPLTDAKQGITKGLTVLESDKLKISWDWAF